MAVAESRTGTTKKSRIPSKEPQAISGQSKGSLFGNKEVHDEMEGGKCGEVKGTTSGVVLRQDSERAIRIATKTSEVAIAKKDGNGDGDLIVEVGTAFSRLAVETSKKSTADLKRELAELLGLTASNLLRLAAVVAELEKRGEDMSDIKMGLLPILRQIAKGNLLPEIVVMFGGEPSRLQLIGKMPVAEQRQIVVGTMEAPIPVRRTQLPTCRPRVQPNLGLSTLPVGPALPTSANTFDLQKPIDEALYELSRLKSRYGHIAELKYVFKAFDEIQSSRGMLEDLDERTPL